VSICSIDGDLKEKLRKFRFRKATNNAAVVSKKTFFILVMSGPIKTVHFFIHYIDTRMKEDGFQLNVMKCIRLKIHIQFYGLINYVVN